LSYRVRSSSVGAIIFPGGMHIMRIKALLLCIGLVLMGCAGPSLYKKAKDRSVVDYVNPFIGTAGKGNTFPGATIPYGMVQLSPDNGRNGWDWISGYYYPDSVIAGFSHTHLSGTGAGDLYDISFMPYSGEPVYKKLDDSNPDKTLVSQFDHQNEVASPGYYQVYLRDYRVNVELTTGLRVGVQKYRFDDVDKQAHVILDLGYERNWDKTTDSFIEIVDEYTIRGYRYSSGWVEDQRVYFYTRFSQPIANYHIDSRGLSTASKFTQGKRVKTRFDFKLLNSRDLIVASGISSVSAENAKLNFDNEIKQTPNASLFAQLHNKARLLWEQELSKVSIEASEDNKIQFYTALYHSALAPRVFSDVNGEYRGPDGGIHRQAAVPRYELFSLWDTFRALHPWKTITHPKQSAAMMQSLIAHYKVTGLLPVWNFQGSETNMMMGYHAVPVLVDAYLKGLVDIDGEELLEMLLKSARQEGHGIKEYQALGYVPYEAITWNVSRTLEYAFDDYAIAKLAERLNKNAIAKEFYHRSLSYRHHFDASYGLMRAKSSKGIFREPFDPQSYQPEDYCEGNAWQHSFFVPHDIGGLMGLYPSKTEFIRRLDQVFNTPQSSDTLPDWISGYIGQYVHGNEPAHHMPYIYRLAGRADKGEAILRRLMHDFYTTEPDGLCGNEDVGQMSAWYLFSALGFYPLNPVSGEYVFGSPEVTRASIRLENGKVFHIQAQNQSPENVYVKEIWLNGVRVEGNILSHEQIMQGGDLRFVMSPD